MLTRKAINIIENIGEAKNEIAIVGNCRKIIA
jgi:hypothetical protein